MLKFYGSPIWFHRFYCDLAHIPKKLGPALWRFKGSISFWEATQGLECLHGSGSFPCPLPLTCCTRPLPLAMPTVLQFVAVLQSTSWPTSCPSWPLSLGMPEVLVLGAVLQSVSCPQSWPLPLGVLLLNACHGCLSPICTRKLNDAPGPAWGFGGSPCLRFPS